MSVVSVQEMAEGRDGVPVGSVDNLRVRRQWLVTTSDKTDNQFTIASDTTFTSATPSYLEVHPSNLFYTCRVLSLEPQSPLHWYAVAEYSTAPVSTEERERNEYPNPINRPAKFSVDTMELQKYVDRDANDKPYNNSAGAPFEPQIKEDSRFVLNIRRNVSTFSTSWWDLRGTLNQKAHLFTDGRSNGSFGIERALFKRLGMSELQEENGYQFYTLQGVFHVDSAGWVKKLRDQGFHYRETPGNPPSGKFIRFKVFDSNSNGDPTTDLISSPDELPLDGNGGPLKNPDGTLAGTAAEDVFLDFDEFPTADWTTLPFWS